MGDRLGMGECIQIKSVFTHKVAKSMQSSDSCGSLCFRYAIAVPIQFWMD